MPGTNGPRPGLPLRLFEIACTLAGADQTETATRLAAADVLDARVDCRAGEVVVRFWRTAADYTAAVAGVLADLKTAQVPGRLARVCAARNVS